LKKTKCDDNGLSYHHTAQLKNMLDDNYFMRQALLEAQKAFSQDEVPVGAVVVSGQRIIARAHNLTEMLNDVTAHAEMQAITAAANILGGKYLIDCTLYVTVEPCPMCAGALRWAQLSRLVYGATDEKRGYTTLTAEMLHPKTEVTAGVMAEECGELMKQFFARRR
jgi:tRNA(adenine34) deaminase